MSIERLRSITIWMAGFVTGMGIATATWADIVVGVIITLISFSPLYRASEKSTSINGERQ